MTTDATTMTTAPVFETNLLEWTDCDHGGCPARAVTATKHGDYELAWCGHHRDTIKRLEGVPTLDLRGKIFGEG